MFKSTKPAGQPRTLRSVAEEKGDPSKFPPPARIPEKEATYAPVVDSAELAKGVSPRPSIDPHAFIKKGS